MSAQGRDASVEDATAHGGPLATHRGRLDHQQTVQAHFAGPSPGVPVPSADIVPVASPPGLLGGVAIMVLARHLRHDQPLTGRGLSLTGEHEDRSILALGRILFVRHPGPHDLTGVGLAIGIGGVGEVGQAQGADVVDARLGRGLNRRRSIARARVVPPARVLR